MKLVNGCRADYLFNTIRGEIATLEGKYRRSVLDFDYEGDGFVSPRDDLIGEDSLWVSEYLKYAVYKPGDQKLYLKSCNDTELILHSERMTKGVVERGFVCPLPDEKRCDLLVYVSDVPRGGSMVQWLVPRACDLLFGDVCGSWTSKRRKCFAAHFDKHGLGLSDHWRKSWRSIALGAQKQHQRATQAQLAVANSTQALSSTGLICLVGACFSRRCARSVGGQ